MPLRRCVKCGKFIKGDGVSLGGKYYHKGCAVCAYCGVKLTSAYVICKGNLYHTECNPATGQKICAYCRKSITGTYYILHDKLYHTDCYHKHVQKTCYICRKPIGVETYTWDYWGNYAHTMHGTAKTLFCYACGRIIASSGKRIGANAVLCDICAMTAVTTAEQVEVCRKRVLQVFDSLGITDVPRNTPIELKSQDEMEHRLGYNHHYVTRHLSRADFRITITRALPALYFQGVLAHEMLHSWLTLFGREVTQDEAEGFCNLGEAFVYTKDDSPFAHYLLKRIYENADEIYGEGYRLQKERYEKLGWAGLLASLRSKS